jgi:hypothetical protein
VRFYDLARDPIVCPACGAHFTVAPAAVVAVGTPFTNKTGWRSKGLRRPKSALPVADPEEGTPGLSQDTVEDAAGVEPEDDLVLEPEVDGPDADVNDLVGRDAVDPKERQ